MDLNRGKAEAQAADDEALFAQVAAGDTVALRRFYFAFHRRLHRFLLRVTHDPQLADEAVNDTMMIVWQQSASFRHESRVSTWVMGIAYRRALKALEAQRRARAAVDSERDRQTTLADGAPGGEDLLAAAAERDDWLERALAELSDEHRLVIELAYYVGASCEEIAVIADCPVGTVKTRLHYARKHLHGRLEILQGIDPRRPGVPS
jgi:RNA polymerase sigma-70 factor, ECF subfamily